MIKKLLYTTLCLLALHGCKIENDIPYPIEEANIENFEVEGQLSSAPEGATQAGINRDTRTVTLYVDDTVDLTKLRIMRLTIAPEGTELIVDEEACVDKDRFPTTGFEIPDNLADTRMDFSSPVQFTLRTYQDYVWTVNVTQVIDRTPDVDDMIRHVIDEENHRAYIYVSPDKDLRNIQIHSLPLGGPSGSVEPDPTTIHDFSAGQEFMVSNAWDPEHFTKWTVRVFHEENTTGTASVFPMSTRATLSGSIVSGKTPVVEYKTASASAWSELPSSAVSVNGSRYTATFTGLQANTSYQCRVSVDGVAGAAQSFTTAPATPLENGSFDNWSSEPAKNGTLWQPWSTTSFWDTGNKGATTIGDSNSIPTEETCNGSGRAASLETRWVVMKLAAGNIFTGSYVKTDGTNGILSFGREFNAFPTKLRINYKYTSSTINRIGDDDLTYLSGRADSCHIYIALTDWDQPYEIRTRKSERQLFNKNDSHVIAYAEYISGSSDSQYQQRDLVLDYRYTNRTPKYILVVATASKYGDYFTGGDTSKLLIDNFELIYE